jgi:uncharacterized protein (TIGR02001 family)
MDLKSMLAAVAVAPLLTIAAPALAQEDADPPGDWEIDGYISGLTDYRFRGISLSGKDPAVQAEVSVSHASGLYGVAWASNVDLGDGADDVEIDLSLGYAADIGNVSVDVGAIYYLYPGNSGFNYIELYGSVGASLGPASVTLGAAYAPEQDNIGDQDNIYVYVSTEVAIGESPLSLHGTFGIEDGAFGDSKRDWLIGASYDLGGGFSATLDYVDTHRAFTNLGDATAVFSITKSF